MISSELEEGRNHRSLGGRVVIREWKGERVPVVEGQFAYKLSGDARRRKSMPSLRAFELEAVRGASRVDETGVGVLYADPDLLDRDDVIALWKSDEFEWIEPLLVDFGCAVNDRRAGEQWALGVVDADGAWALQENNGAVVLAILDTGIAIRSAALSHEDVDDARITIGPNVLASGLAIDDHGHGTHIAGIAAAERNNAQGIAGLWNGPVYIVKVLDQYKAGHQHSFSNGVQNAIELARVMNARLVVNYSAAGPASQEKLDTVQRLRDVGALLITAVGNNQGGSVRFPAAYSTQETNVIAVTAVGRDLRRAAYANRGAEVTVAAPGTAMLSTLPDYPVTITTAGKQLLYDEMDGTSQATSVVAAVAAMVWAKFPALTADEVRARITATATDVGAAADDLGAGIVNARGALS